MALVSLENTVIDLKKTAYKLGVQKLSFASADQLYRTLGIVPGTVSPLSVINDNDAEAQVVLDCALLQHTSLNFHPLGNDRTTNIATADFLRILEATKHSPLIIDFEDA